MTCSAMLYDLYDDSSTGKYFRCWGTCVKLCYSIPHSTHRYFVSNYLAADHYSTRTKVIARYVKFYKSCLQSKSPEVSLVARLAGYDKSSVTGRNLCNIYKETGLNVWTATPRQVSQMLHEKENPTPVTDLWRLPFLGKLLEERRRQEMQLEDTKEINEFIDSLCST